MSLYTIKSFQIGPMAKFYAICYGIMGTVAGFAYAIFFLISSKLALALATFIMCIVGGAIAGAIAGVIMAFIYNVIASKGKAGIVVELESKD